MISIGGELYGCSLRRQGENTDPFLTNLSRNSVFMVLQVAPESISMLTATPATFTDTMLFDGSSTEYAYSFRYSSS